MKNIDARRLSHDKLTELRNRGVTAEQNGESPEVVAKVDGTAWMQGKGEENGSRKRLYYYST